MEPNKKTFLFESQHKNRNLNLIEAQNNKLHRVIFLCYDFSRQLSYHRVLSNYIKQNNKIYNLNFWQIILNDTIDIAVLEWCYFFKSHNDDLHWKNVVDDIDSFRNGLYVHLNLKEKEWKNYREVVAEYRDKNVAHHELLDSINIPDMTIALNAVEYYYRQVKGSLPNIEMYEGLPSSLIDYYSNSEKQSEKIMKIAFESTKNM